MHACCTRVQDRACMFRQKIMEEKCTVVVVLAEYVRLGP
jgi:hypothetical protein